MGPSCAPEDVRGPDKVPGADGRAAEDTQGFVVKLDFLQLRFLCLLLCAPGPFAMSLGVSFLPLVLTRHAILLTVWLGIC